MNLFVKAGIAALGGAVIFIGITGLDKNKATCEEGSKKSDDGSWNKATEGFRDTQNVIGKLGVLVSTLTTTTELLGQLFSVRPLSSVNPTTIIL